jgi:hypothetical protein
VKKLARITGLAAGVLALAVPVAGAAGPADVTVRVEGSGDTLVPRTALTTTTTPVNKSGRSGEECSGTSAAGALELATSGRWTGEWSSFGTYSVDEIKGERHTFSDPEYWSFWVNGKPAESGVCGVELQTGDDVLFFPDVNCWGEGCDPREVLDLQVPSDAQRGVAFTARVFEISGGFDDSYSPVATRRPAAGATISVPGGAVTTGADGTAQVTLGHEPGPVQLRVTKPGTIRETETVCVTEGGDGICGTRDETPPEGRITGIAEQARLSTGPRELTGTVGADPSGLLMVKLRLTRRHNGKCWYFSGRRERLVKSRCGRSFPFAIGDRADVSYLLPKALPKGRYVLDLIAIDKAYNRDQLARGRNRVVFYVG